jgi:hypothetical protein
VKAFVVGDARITDTRPRSPARAVERPLLAETLLEDPSPRKGF